MNWNRCSKVGLALLCALFLAVSPVAAVTTGADGTPDSAQVGEQATTTYTFTELYDQYDQWTLRGQTQLQEVTWTVRLYDQTGSRIARETYNGGSFTQRVSANDDVNRVEVEVTGTVPQVSNFSYEPPQEFTLAAFTQTQQGGTSAPLTSDSVRHYTESSQEARNALDTAATAVEGAGAGEELLNSAISSYNNGNFENAIDLAEQAETAANQAQQSQQTNQLLLYAGAGVVLLLVIGGGVYWFLSNRDTNDPLS